MNTDGRQVYSKVVSEMPMPLHLSEDTPLDILDDFMTDYLRVNVGRFICSWVTGNFEGISITHHTETGQLLIDQVTQRQSGTGPNNWPELRIELLSAQWIWQESLVLGALNPRPSPMMSMITASHGHVGQTAHQ